MGRRGSGEEGDIIIICLVCVDQGHLLLIQCVGEGSSQLIREILGRRNKYNSPL